MTTNVDPFIDKNAAKKVTVSKVAELLERNNIDLEEIGAITRVNIWQGMSKNEDGEPEVTDLVGVQISPAWADGPQWPVVQPAAPTVVKPKSVKRKREENVRKTVLLPDPQVGYWQLSDGTLINMHDERAMDVALQIIEDVQPNRIVNLGDFLDASEWSSKFTVYPEFVKTTQPALDRAHLFLAQQRAAAGDDARIDLIAGNHDDRLGLAIARNAMSALRLRRANCPEEWPVMSVANLLRLEELNVNYVDGYPAGRIKLAEANGILTPLYALHGEKTDMKKQASSERHSTVQGHAHHFGVHTNTYDYDGTPALVQSISLGCLCRVDGAVPSTKGSINDRGRFVQRIESWQHSIGILTETEHGWWIEPVMINNGQALYRDKLYLSDKENVEGHTH